MKAWVALHVCVSYHNMTRHYNFALEVVCFWMNACLIVELHVSISYASRLGSSLFRRYPIERGSPFMGTTF